MNITELIKQRENHVKIYNDFISGNSGNFNIESFIKIIKDSKIKNPKILELGTKRSNVEIPTNHKNLLKSHGVNIDNYIMSDISEGVDVDITADIHSISSVFEENSIDFIIIPSVYEHLKYPTLATQQLLKILKVNGSIFITTHQAFPLHGYPYDYYRFSIQAFKGLFNKYMNCTINSIGYTGPCVIIPHTPVKVWNEVAESYLHINLIATKIAETPNNFIYDIDVV